MEVLTQMIEYKDVMFPVEFLYKEVMGLSDGDIINIKEQLKTQKLESRDEKAPDEDEEVPAEAKEIVVSPVKKELKIIEVPELLKTKKII